MTNAVQIYVDAVSVDRGRGKIHTHAKPWFVGAGRVHPNRKAFEVRKSAEGDPRFNQGTKTGGIPHATALLCEMAFEIMGVFRSHEEVLSESAFIGVYPNVGGKTSTNRFHLGGLLNQEAWIRSTSVQRSVEGRGDIRRSKTWSGQSSHIAMMSSKTRCQYSTFCFAVACSALPAPSTCTTRFSNLVASSVD